VHAALAATTLLLEKEGEWERAFLLAPRQLLATRPAAHPRFAAILSRLDASHSWLGQDAIARVGDEPREEDTRGGGRAHRRHGVLEARFSQPVGFSTAALAGLLLSACAARTAAIATEDSRRRSWLSPSSPARRSSMLALASYFRLGALGSERGALAHGVLAKRWLHQPPAASIDQDAARAQPAKARRRREMLRAAGRSMAKVAPVIAKRAMPGFARPRHHCGFGGLFATNGRRHRRFGRSSRPRGWQGRRGRSRSPRASGPPKEAAGRRLWSNWSLGLIFVLAPLRRFFDSL